MHALIQTALCIEEKSRNLVLLTKLFQNQDNIDGFLYHSTLFALAQKLPYDAALTPRERQMSAKLHCYHGIPCLEQGETRIDTYARSKVYDLRQYKSENFWGPFADDGSGDVDWEKVEAIMMVLGYNLRVFSERTSGRWPLFWDKPFEGIVRNSFVSPPLKSPRKEPAPPIDALDPYGITGCWMRVVCFLDYTDLHRFNFGAEHEVPDDEPREPLDTEEAIRLITMRLTATKIEPPDPDDGQGLPVVYFTGLSRSMHAGWDPNANSSIRGSVRLTKEGEVRWTTISVFHGEERWRSEGIQVGGVRSARGVLGTWFDKYVLSSCLM